MVVVVVHTRDRRRGLGGGEAPAMTSRNMVRLASRSVAATAPAIPSSSSGGGLSLSRAGGRSLRVTSPPPPASRAGGRSLRATSPPPPASVVSAARWESRTLRSDGEDWEEVVVAAVDADAPDAALQEATEERGVVFGVAPTADEVRAAIASIKKVFEKAPVDSETADLQALALPIAVHPSSGIFVNHFALGSNASEVGLDEWTEPARLVLNSTPFLPKENQSVLDALHLLKEDAFVQKMVLSLSTDNNVWDAVMKNDVVQEFKRSFQHAKETDLKKSSTGPPGFIMWVLENTQAKIMEFFEKILRLVNKLFQAGGKNYDFSDDIVRMSFMLSVFVFIVVTIARIR